MDSKVRKLKRVATLLAGGGILLATTNTGCLSFGATSLVQATDFCFIFDCQSGLFGGTIDPCSGIGSGNQTFESETALPFFTDCPTQP